MLIVSGFYLENFQNLKTGRNIEICNETIYKGLVSDGSMTNGNELD